MYTSSFNPLKMLSRMGRPLEEDQDVIVFLGGDITADREHPTRKRKSPDEVKARHSVENFAEVHGTIGLNLRLGHDAHHGGRLLDGETACLEAV